MSHTTDDSGTRASLNMRSDLDDISALWPAEHDPDKLLVFLEEERAARRRICTGIRSTDCRASAAATSMWS
jgi:hypothetical protein